MRLFVGLRLILPGLASLLILSGCDEQSADRKVQNDVDRSHQLALGGTEESLSQARQLLESASTNASASPATQANAKALLAQIELEAARAAQRDIDRQMMDVSRLCSDITQLGQQIATTNALIAGYRRYDPQEALASIQQKIADATGGPDRAAWFTHENSQIPTLTVLEQDIARLEGEIAAQEAKLQQLSAQRTQVLTEADTAARDTEGPKNESTLEAFRRASDLRKQAADIATDMENVEAALLPLRKDLGIAQGQEQVINRVVVELQQQGEALQRAWQQIQQQISAQGALARAILQGAAGSASAASVVPAGGSISNKASELAEIVTRLATLRERALKNARDAAENYGQAVSKAMELRQQLAGKIQDTKNQSRPELNSWKTMRDVMDPAVFRLQQSAAQRTLAGILASHAQELHMRIDLRNALTPILQSAGLPLPDQLAANNADQDRKTALTEANAAYEAANGLLENITEGQAQADVKSAASVARMLTLYAWSELNRAGGDEKSAEEHLELARQVRNAAIEANIVLPTLPAGLSPKSSGPTSPSTAPATEALAPATAPDPAAPPADQPAPGN